LDFISSLQGEEDMLRRAQKATRKQTKAHNRRLVLRAIVDSLVAATDGPLLGIGIGTPGLMDPLEGVVRRAVNLEWQDLPLRSLLQKRYALPVHMANDCQVAALAEYAFGQGRGLDNLAVVKVEHGIGAGMILSGQLYYGDSYGAGEIGHITVINAHRLVGHGRS
jgi:predicted NBD/HSP70 family sugar kinase